MSASYHQLGMIAQLRGDYAAAEDRYRQSLAIAEEPGDRAGAARSSSQLGVLYTELGRAADAVPYNLASLAVRLRIGVPEARVDLHWLGRQREMLGDTAFQAILADHLDPDDVAALLGLLDSATAGDRDTGRGDA